MRPNNFDLGSSPLPPRKPDLAKLGYHLIRLHQTQTHTKKLPVLDTSFPIPLSYDACYSVCWLASRSLTPLSFVTFGGGLGWQAVIHRQDTPSSLRRVDKPLPAL